MNDLKRSIGLRIFVYYDHEGSITMSQKATIAMYLLDLESMRKDSINVMISDYHKSENGMLPVQVKSPAHYVYTRMALQKAYDAGFDDCIFMNTNGFITECSRASIFIIKNNMILTPSLSSTVLDSITRRSCITLAQELSIPVYEMPLTRDNVFSADAAFSAGSSLGLTEINRIDSIMLETSNNKVYKQIKEKYMNCVLGREHHEWITTI